MVCVYGNKATTTFKAGGAGQCIWYTFLMDKPWLVSKGVKQHCISSGPYPSLVKRLYAGQGPGIKLVLDESSM